MARTLVQIRKQIENLEKEAESVRKIEVDGVIARIKKAIDLYPSGKPVLTPGEIRLL